MHGRHERTEEIHGARPVQPGVLCRSPSHLAPPARRGSRALGAGDGDLRGDALRRRRRAHALRGVHVGASSSAGPEHRAAPGREDGGVRSVCRPLDEHGRPAPAHAPARDRGERLHAAADRSAPALHPRAGEWPGGRRARGRADGRAPRPGLPGADRGHLPDAGRPSRGHGLLSGLDRGLDAHHRRDHDHAGGGRARPLGCAGALRVLPGPARGAAPRSHRRPDERPGAPGRDGQRAERRRAGLDGGAAARGRARDDGAPHRQRGALAAQEPRRAAEATGEPRARPSAVEEVLRYEPPCS